MEAIIASAIAVLGTLIGSGITLGVQRRTAERGHQFTREERLRQERLDAYAAYAAALIDYRRCLVHLWFCRHEQPPPEAPEAVRMRAYDLRSRAQEALFRTQMLTDDEELGRIGEGLLAEITEVPKAESPEEFERRRARTRDGIAHLVRTARQYL